MIKKEFKEAIFEFVKKVSDLDEISSITLFGSVAEGKATIESDIDMLVIVSNMKIEKDITKITNEISDKCNKKFQVITKTKKLGGLDPSMIESISKDGILLYGLPVKVRQKDLELEPYLIAVYSLAGLPQSEKMKFKRAIFGSESVFKGKEKSYRTVQEGILKMYNGARLGRGAIIFSCRHKEIIKQIEYFKIKFKVFTVYADKNILEWISTFNKAV